ncbi:hypothetical protein PIROE2DRAFT_16718, partial [Piromyces sp. E2]
GRTARVYGRQAYNIKIRGNDDLYGRSQFKLRADPSDATLLRSKLICDIHNRLGVPSISANYVSLYINDEYMGLYVMMDAIKPSWIKYVYDDKDSTTLYQCQSRGAKLSVETSYSICNNENEDVKDRSEWYNFLNALDNATSAADIEDILDIDQFLTEMALEYLTGAFDHYLDYGHNYYMYKPKNETKWKFLSYDFDYDLGQDIDISKIGIFVVDLPEQLDHINMDYPNYSFEEFAKPSHLIDILIYKDPRRFEEILKNVVTKVFNPATLYPHIDELKAFIKPYIELDKIPNSEGYLPGKINKSQTKDYTMAQWDANSEFTTIETISTYRAYGLKYWILAKYRYVCKTYGMTCDPIYMDENFQYPIDKSVETIGYDDLYQRETPINTFEIPVEKETASVEIPTEITLDQETTIVEVNSPKETTTVEFNLPKETTTIENNLPKETTSVEIPTDTTLEQETEIDFTGVEIPTEEDSDSDSDSDSEF